MSESALKLHRKLAQIMYEAERIPKNGRAPKEMGGYPFVQVGDAADYIRKALAEKIVTMMPVGVQVVGQADRPTKSGGTMTTVDLITTWRITDGETGESIEIQSFGAGADGGDKYSGKASTSAMKYALLSGFLLSTGEDSELGSHEAARPRTPAEVNAQERAQLAKREVIGAYMDGDDLKGSDVKPVLDALDKRGTIDNGDGSLIGTAELAKDFPDFMPTPGKDPEGNPVPVLAFKLRAEGGIKVIAYGVLAEVLPTIRDEVIGQRVSCWGRVRDETFRPRNAKKDITYQVLDLERIKTASGILPARSVAPVGPDEPPDDVPLVGEEAPTAPLFDDVA